VKVWKSVKVEEFKRRGSGGSYEWRAGVEKSRSLALLGMTTVEKREREVDGGNCLLLNSPRSRVIIGPLDTLVDIGAFAEKEVIQ